MAVADREQRTGNVDGDIEGTARYQFLEVEIAGVGARHTVRDVAAFYRRRDADCAPEWRGLDRDARVELNGAGLSVDPEELVTRVREVVGERAAAAESVPAEGMQ